MRSSRERVPTSVQRRPQAPSEPSGAGGPARGAARRALPALQKPVRKTKADRCRPAGAPRIQVSRSRRPGRGGLGAFGAAAVRAPGRRRLRGSVDARRKLHESCPLLLLRSPPRAGPRPLLPRRAGLGRGTHPRRARLPGCAARAPDPRRAHALPLGSNLQASMAGRPPRAAGGRAARWARGPGGGRAGARLGGCGGAAPSAEGPAGYAARPPTPTPRRRRRCLCLRCLVPAIRNNVQLPGRRLAPRSPLSLFLSLAERQPLSRSRRDVRPRGRGQR